MSQTMLDDQQVTTQVNTILSSALQKRASDIHLEPRERNLRVRFRIDGMLVEQTPVSKALTNSVIGRTKVLAQLDVAEKRMPQDGGFTHETSSGKARFRASTLPTDWGEKIVLRLLSQRGVYLDLGRLGMSETMAASMQRIVDQPDGVILVTGPTGSGKTSTLYSLLRCVDAKKRNVVTLEDPIEIRFPEVIQTRVHPKSGYTFAVGLRAILRQDPDIVMVGEMRDIETADTALKAGLTGHLVLSSLHTNSAVDTFLRLIDMGLEPFVVATSVRAVVSQRLVRRLCPECRLATAPDEKTRETLGITDPAQAIYEEQGCPKCVDTGYRGRLALFEFLEVDDDLADLVKSEHASRKEYRALLATRDMQTLRASGIKQVLAGTTTLREVLRVT